MKVLLISHTCQSLTEGQPKAAEIAARLHGEILVLTPDRWKHYGQWRHPQFPKCANYRIIAGKVRLPWAGPGQFYMHWYPGLSALLRRFQPDIIDIWEEPWSLVSTQVCWLREKMLPHACIISETEQNIARNYPVPFCWFRSQTFSQADLVIGRSSEALEIIRSQGYTGPARIIPNAVDPVLFHPMRRENCRREFGFKGFVVGYIGRLVERKGLLDLINALPLCSETTMLIFVGEGNYLSALQTRVAELAMESRVQFIPECSFTKLPRLMNTLDILVLPSRTTPTWKEQFGRVIIEAHACGIPVIGSSSGAIPDVIGCGGIIFPEQNPVALATCIKSLEEAPTRIQELGTVGLKQVLTHYTWSRVAEQMLDIYKKIRRRH